MLNTCSEQNLNQLLVQNSNLFKCIEASAFGIAALGDLLKHADLSELEDYTINHLSYVLNVISSDLFSTCDTLQKAPQKNNVMKGGATC